MLLFFPILICILDNNILSLTFLTSLSFINWSFFLLLLSLIPFSKAQPIFTFFLKKNLRDKKGKKGKKK